MFDAMIAKVSDSFALLAESTQDSVTRTATIEHDEHFIFQETQALAAASGRIDIDIAFWLYRTLGNSAETFNSRDVPTRIVCLSLLGKIAKMGEPIRKPLDTNFGAY